MKILKLLLMTVILSILSACDGIQLTVENGSGSGTYASNAKVKIRANIPVPGYEFEQWEGDTQYIEDISSKETLVQLPQLSKDEVLQIKIKATYAVDPSAKEYDLVVENGSGSGSYLTYSVVMVTANNPAEGYQFDKWVGNVEYLNSPYLATQKVIMDKEDISLKATYKVKVTPTVTPTPKPTPTQGFSVTPIGESYEHGFFILRKFKNKLIAGAFGYSNKQKIFTYSPWAPASPGFSTKESVCDLREFDNYLYANTENQGQVWRTKDGNNWEKVLDVSPDIGCGLAVFNGYIYATENTLDSAPVEIYRSANGTNWEKVYSSGSSKRYLKEIVTFQNKLYGFYVNLEDDSTGMLVSSDGKSWSTQSAPMRFIRSYVFNNKLWLAGTKKYSSSGESAIYTYDGSSFKKVYADSTKSHISYISSIGTTLVATTTVEWKGKQGGATLIQSCDGGVTWKTMHRFNETEAWGIEEFNGAIYVATKQDGGGGKLYKVTGLCGTTGPDPTPTPTPTGTPGQWVKEVSLSSAGDLSGAVSMDLDYGRDWVLEADLNGCNADYRKRYLQGNNSEHIDLWYEGSSIMGFRLFNKKIFFTQAIKGSIRGLGATVDHWAQTAPGSFQSGNHKLRIEYLLSQNKSKLYWDGQLVGEWTIEKRNSVSNLTTLKYGRISGGALRYKYLN